MYTPAKDRLTLIDRELSMTGMSNIDTDRGLHLLRKHGWKSFARPRDGPKSLTFQTRAPGDRAGIGYDTSARGSGRGDKDNRVSCSAVNVSFIPFPMVRNAWHNILSTRKNRLNVDYWL